MRISLSGHITTTGVSKRITCQAKCQGMRSPCYLLCHSNCMPLLQESEASWSVTQPQHWNWTLFHMFISSIFSLGVLPISGCLVPLGREGKSWSDKELVMLGELHWSMWAKQVNREGGRESRTHVTVTCSDLICGEIWQGSRAATKRVSS